MMIDYSRLCPSPTPLKGFSGEVVQPMGAIMLRISAGMEPCTATTMTDFLVVMGPSSYNVILGCLTFKSLKIVTSTYHLKMKFRLEVGVGKVQGKQVLAQELKNKGRNIQIVESLGSNKAPQPPLELIDHEMEMRDE
ncbi:uncharacterized protein LOC121258675 [Juglans microcarpa x Juglans regia]|uniref:uncharacterized protein LOC121258675 n=1 Tax=Juglans microcarpa x Juglans regia TaxID=2249226 RepID=UPI001B7E7DBB|nr:uncharacterized protein LOC121258675 [Juglans microcarpa x Juglans regia]